MSSSEARRVPVAAWALDELEPPEIFPLGGGAGGAPMPAAADAAEAHATREAALAAADAEGYARGWEEARAALHAEADARVAGALAALADAVDAVRVHEARWLANVEENLAALAVVVARHIVLREVAVDPLVVRDLVRRALAALPVDQPVTVRLNPADLAACRDIGTGDGARVPEVRWLPDPAITRGGCLVEGRERVIDGRVDMALERAYRALGNVQA
jgi:flagellar biosynthesis/type III secretory pathway protein FliH